MAVAFYFLSVMFIASGLYSIGKNVLVYGFSALGVGIIFALFGLILEISYMYGKSNKRRKDKNEDHENDH